MALVTITGNAWDHMRNVIPPELEPELYARPVGATIASGGGSLQTGDEVKAQLNQNGRFSVQVESHPGIRYQMVMSRLVPGQETEPPEMRARAWVEWPFTFLAGDGGEIHSLVDLTPYGPIVAALGAPPSGAAGLVWIDLTDVAPDGAQVYGPPEAY